MRKTKHVALTVWFLALAFPYGVKGQVPPTMTEAEMVTALGSDDPVVRDRTVNLAMKLGWRAGPELRAAVIRVAWAELRGETNRPLPGGAEHDEYLFDYFHAVAGLRDPAAIPFLITVMRHGAAAANALADLGAAAFPAVLEAANTEDYRDVRMSLLALRFMVEDGTVSEEDMPEVVEVARRCLTGRQHWRVVLGAMHLSVGLADPALLDMVAMLVNDRAAVVDLLGPGSGFIQRIQEDARDLLSGEQQPYPKRRPFPGPPGAPVQDFDGVVLRRGEASPFPASATSPAVRGYSRPSTESGEAPGWQGATTGE